ncbi:hypothetical protein OS493_001504 [Desmophyllum pertusum]|uniref:Uncharacterized protein n=1 Tax=Desmophyllum pertusum TaxID=174260 RepID=A0A9X0CZM9_9CNID|nr:hypothetical protein OS493_001504 [Desmophyllum pertusum]
MHSRSPYLRPVGSVVRIRLPGRQAFALRSFPTVHIRSLSMGTFTDVTAAISLLQQKTNQNTRKQSQVLLMDQPPVPQQPRVIPCEGISAVFGSLPGMLTIRLIRLFF